MYFECQQDFPFLDDFISNSYLTHPLLKYSSTSRIVGPVFFLPVKKKSLLFALCEISHQ